MTTIDLCKNINNLIERTWNLFLNLQNTLLNVKKKRKMESQACIYAMILKEYIILRMTD